MQAISKIDLTQANGQLNDVHDRRITAIDDYPTETSENLVNSDGIARYMADLDAYIEEELNVKDLSTFNVFGEKQSVQNTANTYVVMEPGNYKFPIVYGNAIKEGADNPSAYISCGTTYPERNATTGPFINYLNRAITNGSISVDTGVAPESMTAKLIWQTSPGVITEVSISAENNGYVKFKVGEIPATNADALIAVCDSADEVMWSWLIWAVPSDKQIGEVTITNHTNVDYTLLDVAIGAVWNTGRTTYSAPYFQWGRKDPICPTNPNYVQSPNATNMTLYDIDGKTYTGFKNLGGNNNQRFGGITSTIQNSIKHPEALLVRVSRSGKTSQTWFLDTTEYVNLWNNSYYGVDSNNVIHSYGGDDLATVIKTIYDPCPVGYVVPVRNTFTGTTTDGIGHVDRSGALFNCEYVRTVAAGPGIKYKTKGSDTYNWFIPRSFERSVVNASQSITQNTQSSNIWLNCTYYQTPPASATNRYQSTRHRYTMLVGSAGQDAIYPQNTGFAAFTSWIIAEKEI